MLTSEALHADENALRQIKEGMEPCDYLIAVGSGTIHDAVRYTAHEMHVPFVSVPTAASVDGFVSTVAAMTLGGFKVTTPAVAPVLVVADIDIIKNAPYALTAAGVGDMLGKYTSLCDWKISSLLTNEYYCPEIVRITGQAVKKVEASCKNLKSGDKEAYSDLIYGLLLSGLAMQMAGNSRPASGAEHHMSHFLELGILGAPPDALHGEKVGVATGIVLEEYKKYAKMRDIRGKLCEYTSISKEFAKRNFGDLCDSILKENKNDPLLAVSLPDFEEKWPEIRNWINRLPDAEYISGLLFGIGAKSSFSDLLLPEDFLHKTKELSPFVRNRLTFMRIKKLFRGS